MPTDRNKARELFMHAVAKVPPDGWDAYVAATSGGDSELEREVAEMLRVHREAGSFLSRPALGATGLFSPASPSPSEEAELTRTVIGPYKLVEEIGEGGMGTVWMSLQTEPIKRLVALKLIKPGMDTKQVLARFEAERQALAFMDHPNIARVLDAGATGSGRPYFVMDLVKGQPITTYCDEHRLTPRQRLELFVPVCQAIQHAHQKGVIHRDIKPNNVLVALYDGKPVPRVIDFGVAKAAGQRLTDKTLVTGFGAIVGTLEYMSPEQAEVNQLDVDTRSDIYSLGVLLYELLSGTTPLERKRARETGLLEALRIIREEEVQTLSNRLSTLAELPAIAINRGTEPTKLTKLVRGELDWIVMKALEKDRNRRYETANSFAIDVQRYLADEPVAAGPPSAAYRLRKFTRRNRWPILAASLVVLALVGGIVGTTVGLVQAEQKRKDAVAAKEAEAEERAIAQAVNDFVQIDLLGQADLENQPGGASGDRDPDIKVRTVLDRAARMAETRFANQPRVEAAIRLTIAKAYLALGRSKETLQHAERSVVLRTTDLGADHLDTLASKDVFAQAYCAEGCEDQAKSLYREVLEKRTAILGPDHLDTLTSKQYLGQIYLEQGKLEQAEQLNRELLQKRESQLGSHDAATLQSKLGLAWLHYLQGRFDLAEAEYIELISTFETRLGEDHPGTLLSKSNLGLVYGSRGKYDLAEPLFKEVMEKRIALQGPDHFATLNSKVILGSAYREQRKFDLAVPMLEEAVKASKASQGKDDANTLNAMRHLGLTYVKCGKPELALPIFEQMLATYKQKPPQNNFDSLIIMRILGGAYLTVKMPGKALPLFREFVDGQRKQLGADSLEFAGWVTGICQDLLRHEQYPEAEKHLRECLAILERLEPDSWQTLNTRSMLGISLLGQKKYTDAEPLLLASYAGLKRDARIEPQVRDVRLRRALERLVQLYEATNKLDEAAKWRRELEALTSAAGQAVKPKAK